MWKVTIIIKLTCDNGHLYAKPPVYSIHVDCCTGWPVYIPPRWTTCRVWPFSVVIMDMSHCFVLYQCAACVGWCNIAPCTCIQPDYILLQYVLCCFSWQQDLVILPFTTQNFSRDVVIYLSTSYTMTIAFKRRSFMAYKSHSAENSIRKVRLWAYVGALVLI